MKQINITDIKTKEINISKQKGEISINILYGLLDDQDKDWDFKTDQIKDADLDTTTKNKINNVLQTVKDIIRQREGIN